MNFKVFAVLAVLALAGSAAAARKRVTKKDVGPAFPTVADALVEGNYTQLVDAATLANLVEVLADPEFVGTVFAPVDKAFASLVDEVTPLGLAPALADPAIVTSVLTYHVLNTTVKAAELKDGDELETLNGAVLTVVLKDNKVYVEDVNGRRALVGKPDIAAGKAIVHAINKVLLPIEVVPVGNATEVETPVTETEGTETAAPEGTEVAPPTGAASGLMASAAAVAASLVAAAFLA